MIREREREREREGESVLAAVNSSLISSFT
jgi:hypothetical protein